MENNNQVNTQSPTPMQPKNSKLRENLRGAWDLIKFAVIALAIVIPVRMFIAQPFVVNGDSMFPTFHNKEYLIVDEISYIVRSPARSEVTIFRYPNDPSRFFIKRIIGMPNETIEIKNGVVKIINKENPDGFILEEPYLNEKFTTTETFTTGNDQYFVMGDNRNRSSDSRSWGVLLKKFMIGRAYLRLLPVGNLDYLPGAITTNK
jgi:signal peptidase I